MPNLFRTLDGHVWKPKDSLRLAGPDGAEVSGIWAGSAQVEKLDWRLRQPGNQLAQTEPVAAIATKADDDDELQWGEAPQQARLFFIVEPPEPGKNYRKALMLTTAATAAQVAYFRHTRFSLFGTLRPDGSIQTIPPVEPPPPNPPTQGTLF